MTLTLSLIDTVQQTCELIVPRYQCMLNFVTILHCEHLNSDLKSVDLDWTDLTSSLMKFFICF